MPIRTCRTLSASVGIALIASACGGDLHGPTAQASSNAESPPLNSPSSNTTSVTPAALTATLKASTTGQSVLQIAGSAFTCGIDVRYLQYDTVGGAGEPTTASGVLMVPTGSGPACSGARPIIEYAHGTTLTKSYNLAALNDPTNQAYTESLYIAALYAAHGYIVVAPNYAGYDSSTLGYHPYLNAAQASTDMIDALQAAKGALPSVSNTVTASDKLFLTGYSEGGYVAMATARAMQAANIPVTASAFMSGPYALASFGDAIFSGEVDLGSTAFFPMIYTSYQKAYGNLYSSPADVYESAYANGIETLVPGPYTFSTIISNGKLPQSALFNSTPPTGPAVLQPTLNALTPPTGFGAADLLFALGFGPGNLIRNSARLSYLLDAFANPDGVVPKVTTNLPSVAPQNPLRVAFKKNDLRGWTPTSPVLLCGGHQDPTVFYNVNTGVMKQEWAGLGSLVKALDVDSPLAGDGFDAARLNFAGSEAVTAVVGGPVAVAGAYHGSLVLSACMLAASTFFGQYGS